MAIIVIVIALTGFFGYFLKDIRINPDITTYFPADDSVVTRFNYIGENYSSSSMGIIILETDEVFSKETILHINELTNLLRSTEGVDFVTSLTNVLDVRMGEDSSIQISRLIDEYDLPQTPEALKKVKEYTLSKELYKGRLVSADSRYAAIICRINEDFDKNDISLRIQKSVKDLNLPETIYFEGMPFQMLNIFDYILKDLFLLIPMIVLLIALTLLISFRSTRGVVLPVVSVGIGIIWCMGLMALLKIPLTPVSDAIPVVLFAVGVAYSIHVINKFNERVTDAGMRKEQSKQALSEVGLAVLLAGLTTFVGFLSFIFGAYLVIIRDFGIFSSLGILFILIISLTFTPAVLSYLKPKAKPKSEEDPAKKTILLRWIDKLSWMATQKRITVIIISTIIMLGSLIGIPFLKNKVDILNYFREDTDIRRSSNVMNREFGGSVTIQIIVRGDIQDPVVMKEIRNFQNFLEQQDKVSNTQSPADFIEQMNEAMGEGKRIPDSRDKISNLWFLIEGEEMLSQVVNTEKTEAVIQAFMTNTDNEGYYALDQAIDQYITQHNSNKVTFYKAGMAAIYTNLGKSLTMNLIQSMVISLILIFICMLFLVKTFKAALAGMVPLLFSMIFIFGFMGVTGIALDIATVLIASITVGAGIDYSIHFVTAYQAFIRRGMSIDEAIHQTINTSGKAIIINVVTIILGFLVLIFANLLPLQQFGILIAVTMFISAFGAITLLPALISRFKIRLVSKKSSKNINTEEESK
ncbi:MAG: MMPL family transporter [Bacteroidales bacterium]|nr:MMPL family transporter [Bacteroidales bacterium]